jgi:hypothetical protein
MRHPKQLRAALLVFFAFNMVPIPSFASADGSGEVGRPDEHKLLACPQCGSWNISEARMMKAGNGSNKSELARWLNLAGETIVINRISIAGPFIGKIRYEKQATRKIPGQNEDVEEMTLKLLKARRPGHAGDAIDAIGEVTISGHPGQEVGFGEISMDLETSSGELLKLSGWNPDRHNPDLAGTPGEGQRVLFELARSAKKLSSLTRRTYATRDQTMSTFDMSKFTRSAEEYCGDLFSEATYNPSIGVRILQCELKIHHQKTAEFQAFRCERNSRCVLPNETFDKSIDYSEFGQSDEY